MKLMTNIYLKKIYLLPLVYLISISVFGKNENQSLTDYLDHIIINKQQFTQHKEQRITSLKNLLNEKPFSLEYEYEINLQLYGEYKKFKLDSATHYAEKNLQIAKSLNNPKLISESYIQLAASYSYSGMQRESEEILKNIDVRLLPKELLPEYYEAYSRFFEHYGAVSRQPKYMQKTEIYRDSLMAMLNPDSFRYKINLVHKYIIQGQTDKAEKLLLNLLENEDIDTPNYALITHYLGSVNQIKKNFNAEKKYFTLSAIADIKNSIKENASFQRLSLIHYENGDIARAFNYAQSAIEDAVFSGAQFRTAQMSEFYSIINASYQQKEIKAKSQLKLYLTLISLLTVFMIMLVIYVYKQIRKISVIKEQLTLTNNKLTLLNKELNNSNNRLSDANHIKEQYIVHFLDLCSDYILKIEDYRKDLHKLALNNQFDKIMKILKSTTFVDNEIEELYKNFDSVFLNLYPTFISDFNSLLQKDEQITLKSEDLLNKELRIYALLRLGITDSVKIAAFLRCSLSTIYNYRSKIRNKAIVPRDEFEEIVMKIGVLHKKD